MRWPQAIGIITGLLLASFAVFGQEELPTPSKPIPFVPPPAAAAVVLPATDDDAPAEVDSIAVRRALVGLGEYQVVGDMLLVDDESQPQQTLVGLLSLVGSFDTASVIADDANRNLVPVDKISDRQWIIRGAGKVVVVATLATQQPFGIEQRRFVVSIGEPTPAPDVPEPDVPGPDNPQPDNPDPVDVPEDRFDNIGRRVAEATKGLALRAEVAANYRKYADRLVGSVEAAEISLAMIEERSRIIADNKEAWQPMLTLVAEDFTPRRPNMLRSDVVDHWRAIANGLDPK